MGSGGTYDQVVGSADKGLKNGGWAFRVSHSLSYNGERD